MGDGVDDAGVSGDAPLLQSVTVDARRRALEAMAFGPHREHPELELLVLGPLGIASIDPVGERFGGEAEALARITDAQSRDHDPVTQRLSQAALDVWRAAREGTVASRTALLRAVLAYLLHHAASRTALRADPKRSA